MKLLELDNLSVRIGSQSICRNFNLDLAAGQILGVLGRNGIGKTTLLYALMGIRSAEHGTIKLAGTEVRQMTRRDHARFMGMLFQENDNSMPATVLETVLLGRHPYAENLLWDSAEDMALARETLRLLGLENLEQRQVATLSGGEKQRLAIAMILAQDPQLYLLDEPSNHLDIDFQLKILQLLQSRIVEREAAILMASHDINLISRICDRVMLILGDGEIIEGPTGSVLTKDNLQRAFHCRIAQTELAGHRYFVPL